MTNTTTNMNKQQIISALKLEPFSIIDARQKVKDLQSWLDSYDKGDITVEQFESFLYRNTNRASYSIDALVSAIEYVIADPSIEKIMVLSHLSDSSPYAKLLEDYLAALAKAGISFKKHLTVSTADCKGYETAVEVWTESSDLKLKRFDNDLIVWTSVVPSFLFDMERARQQPQATPNYPIIQPKKRMSIEEAFAIKDETDRLLRESYKG